MPLVTIATIKKEARSYDGPHVAFSLTLALAQLEVFFFCYDQEAKLLGHRSFRPFFRFDQVSVLSIS
jgi:hypothetical protein